MRFLKSKRTRAGFTLAEMLMTMLILLMMTSVVAAGMPAAVRAYKKVIDAANARLLLSTTVTELRAELSTAMEVEVDASNNVTHYSNGERGHWSNLLNSDDGIKVMRTSRRGEKTPTVKEGEGESASENPEPVLLVTNKAANENLYATFDDLTYSDGVFTLTGLKVCRENDINITEPMTLQIRAVMAPPASTPVPASP